ncbi:hypothetical protein J4731_11105 [Providencia rettgeri]|nr:hypothetical protein [Providencia rettgeri]
MKTIYDVEDTKDGWKTAGVDLMAQTVQSLQTAIDAQKMQLIVRFLVY